MDSPISRIAEIHRPSGIFCCMRNQAWAIRFDRTSGETISKDLSLLTFGVFPLWFSSTPIHCYRPHYLAILFYRTAIDTRPLTPLSRNRFGTTSRPGTSSLGECFIRPLPNRLRFSRWRVNLLLPRRSCSSRRGRKIDVRLSLAGNDQISTICSASPRDTARVLSFSGRKEHHVGKILFQDSCMS